MNKETLQTSFTPFDASSPQLGRATDFYSLHYANVSPPNLVAMSKSSETPLTWESSWSWN